MAFTAYPDDVGENPNIVASNDGLTWVVPAGLTNPLDPIPGDPAMVNGSRFNSDTDLVHHNGTLYMFWRFRSPDLFKIWMRTSTDGVTWTPRQTVIENTAAQGDPYVSPAITLDEDGVWHMWSGDNTRPQKLYHRTAPSPTGPWSTRQLCPVAGIESYRQNWHFDVLPHDGLYVGLFTLTQNNATNIRGILYLAVSRDGINWTLGPAVLSAPNPAPGWPRTWDSTIIYRCAAVVDDDVLRTWYATAQKIGYTEIPLAHIKPALDAIRYA